MSDHLLNDSSGKTELAFPIIIAITALILSLVSGVVNYRQNNLSNLESSLRDTRDQLQLAKNDISDIKINTVKQLVDAELAVKNQHFLEDSNASLSTDLNDANIRIGELEAQIKRMDHRLSKRSKTIRTASKKARSTPRTSQAAAKNAPTAASADVDIYTSRIAPSLQAMLSKSIGSKGFAVKFPALPHSMSLSSRTTVFYYHDSYKAVAQQLAYTLSNITKNNVGHKKGASPYPNNKIIAHIIGD